MTSPTLQASRLVSQRIVRFALRKASSTQQGSILLEVRPVSGDELDV